LERGFQRGFHASYLSRICQPKTVIDVGVGRGTPTLYQAYPTAKFILVEPLRDYESAIDEIAKKYDCIIYYKALGNTEGVREMNIDPSRLGWSSFKNRSALTRMGNPLQKRQVEVTTLDTICREHQGFERPILLKIDTEGYELEVLQGARDLLHLTDTVIAEVSVARRFEDGYSFEDLILLMKERGFYVYSFLTLAYVGAELRPRFTDIVFKRGEQET
jgi:FkbM family methyltransferase